jgi:hypothetical protein
MSYAAADFGPYHLPIITTLAMESIGDVLANVRSAPASTAWGTANMVRFVPFYITRTVTVVKLLTYNGATAAGASDIGIFTKTGVRIVAGANPAQSGTSTWQEYNITDTALVPDEYFLGLKNDGTTGTYFSVASLPWGKLAGVCSAAGAAGGLASSYTLATLDAAVIPVVAMALRVTI